MKRQQRRRQPDSIEGEHGVLLSPHVVAKMLGVTTGTLRTWRYLGVDERRPWSRLHEHVTLLRRIWYYRDVVLEFKRNNLRYIDAKTLTKLIQLENSMIETPTVTF